MHLSPDIKIITKDSKKFNRNQVEINSGLVQASSNDYRHSALVPKNDFRFLTNEEENTYFTTSQQSSQLISILDIPTEALTFLHKSNFFKAQLDSNFYSYIKEKKHSNIFTDLLNFAQQYSLSSDPFFVTPISIKLPECHTLTADIVDNRAIHVGLHTDKWDKSSFENLSHTTKRMCINLGLQERYFLFINISLKQMYEGIKNNSSVKLPIQYDSFENPFDNLVLHEFKSHYPNYPVTRIKLYPGQAYIAPVENMFHDGSTLGTSNLDVTLSVRGHFKSCLSH